MLKSIPCQGLAQRRLSDEQPIVYVSSSKFCLSAASLIPLIVTAPLRFREMCEDTHAVKALGFLQNEVSSVVDHHDPKETEIFRSLLTHLLAPGPLSPSSPEETQPIGDDSPPRKRSRPNTPEEKWTNVLHTEEIPPALSVSADTLRSLADPMEHRLDDDMTPSKPLTQERFKQRNEVFESLLEFISDDAKQPSESLLDLVDHEMESP